MRIFIYCEYFFPFPSFFFLLVVYARWFVMYARLVCVSFPMIPMEFSFYFLGI
ncbi:hypothetical protein BGX38DRAFT_1198351 [Terfezia claveryi]|nr:hypothetical protein BGX38DRAFT_1198351 [Terfezia claveryi]